MKMAEIIGGKVRHHLHRRIPYNCACGVRSDSRLILTIGWQTGCCERSAERVGNVDRPDLTVKAE
jgi:hypothetical protein